MPSTQDLFARNREWSQDIRRTKPKFFETLSAQQSPRYLWIGCSDSRVPANEVTNTEPGEIFVHRNVANLVVNTDLNLLSVLQYAVEVLEVKHIIVCGHYGCGGVKAAMTQKSYGIINKWLRNIKDVYRFHRDEIDGIQDEQKRVDRLIELNVKEQIHNLAKTSIVQKAWINRQGPTLHGWVYRLDDGILNNILTIDHNFNVDPIYRFDEDELKDL